MNTITNIQDSRPEHIKTNHMNLTPVQTVRLGSSNQQQSTDKEPNQSKMQVLTRDETTRAIGASFKGKEASTKQPMKDLGDAQIPGAFYGRQERNAFYHADSITDSVDLKMEEYPTTQAATSTRLSGEVIAMSDVPGSMRPDLIGDRSREFHTSNPWAKVRSYIKTKPSQFVPGLPTHPYTLTRPCVLVAVRIKEYVPYYGNGFRYGGLNCKKGSTCRKLSATWTGMMKRCYDRKHSHYSQYGGNNISVAKRWHSFENFYLDVQQLLHWELKLHDWNNFDLDKDYYGSNQYGPDTCIWIKKDENAQYTSRVYPIKVTSADGIESTFISQRTACRVLGLSPSTLSRFLSKGVPKTLKGKNEKFSEWKFKWAEVPEGKVMRLKLMDGQLELIHRNPSKRWTLDKGTLVQISDMIQAIQAKPESNTLTVSEESDAIQLVLS